VIGWIQEVFVTETATEPVVPSGRFRPSVQRREDSRQHYSDHMSGSWKAWLVDEAEDPVIESTVWNLGDMVVTVNDFPARRVARPRVLAHADQLDHYYVHLPLAMGGMTVAIDERDDEMLVPAGSPVMMDLSRPFDTLQGAGRSMQAFIPREALDELMPAPRDMHANRLEGAAAGILADLLQSLMRRLPSMSRAEASDVAKSTMHLVAASLAPSPAMYERARPAVESSLLRQACRYIDMHLDEEDLRIDAIGTAVNVSRATLYRLFEPYGGVAHHVKERRLVRSHAAICDGGRRRSLALIAEAHGFKSAAQFSRAFKEHFGYTPSEAPSLARNAAGSQAGTTDRPEGESLAAWLRPLRG
jgi:AraC-like DNA-binding protein